MVRARISSKLAKLSGPCTNAVMALDFSALTPGVTSTSTSGRTRSDCDVRQRDRGEATERHAHHREGVRAPARGWRRRRRRRSRTRSSEPWRPRVGVAVAREVDGDERSIQRQRHGVPGVRVLGAAVEEDELGRSLAPHQRAEPPPVAERHRLPAHGRRMRRRERPNSAAFSWNIENSSYGTRSSGIVVFLSSPRSATPVPDPRGASARGWPLGHAPHRAREALEGADAVQEPPFAVGLAVDGRRGAVHHRMVVPQQHTSHVDPGLLTEGRLQDVPLHLEEQVDGVGLVPADDPGRGAREPEERPSPRHRMLDHEGVGHHGERLRLAPAPDLAFDVDLAPFGVVHDDQRVDLFPHRPSGNAS